MPGAELCETQRLVAEGGMGREAAHHAGDREQPEVFGDEEGLRGTAATDEKDAEHGARGTDLLCRMQKP